MMNLHDGLERIAGPGAEPTTDQIEADLARGRRALRRRRAVQAGGGSAFAVAAVVAAVAFATAGTTTSTPAPLAQGTSQSTSAAREPVRLVAYTGEQPKGFELDKVPDGWEVQGVSESALTLAPIGAEDQDPNSFVGKIAVMLQSADDHSTPEGTEVTVDGDQGVLKKAEGQTDGWTLFVDRKSGPRLQVQVWDGLDWEAKQVVEFATGVTVTGAAQPGRG